MPTHKLSRKRMSSAGIGAFFRPRDLEALDIDFRELQHLVRERKVERVGDGLYRLASAEVHELESIAMAASAIPAGIVCLLSALRLYEIGTQAPHEVWMAINRKARKPARVPVLMRIVRFSGAMLTYGVVTRSIVGVPVRVTSPARTVVDCFRYRAKLGIDVALEAAREALRERKATVDEIMRAAEVCRARTVVQRYLEVMTA
ncbi:MAG TPA: type IV toxin-antitoxin system AbiEi family antitoxin [Candidatus Binatia bacterium]